MSHGIAICSLHKEFENDRPANTTVWSVWMPKILFNWVSEKSIREPL